MSSTLDPDNLIPTGNKTTAKGHDIKSLGPSDSSDSGSDMAGSGLVDDDTLNLDRGTNTDIESGSYKEVEAGAVADNLGMDNNSDRYGTGERLTAGRDSRVHVSSDINVDRIVGPEEAGLGGGLDQAEEAQFGITDEEIAEKDSDR